MRPLYIFDLDGTLADIQHRRHHVENGNKNWDQFHADCVHDTPMQAVIDTNQMLYRARADIHIFSGRSDVVENETRNWLERYHVRFDKLTMRPHGDYTPDDVLKQSWLDAMSHQDRARLVAVFEDRDRMVKMWRANGIACFQVAPGDF